MRYRQPLLILVIVMIIAAIFLLQGNKINPKRTSLSASKITIDLSENRIIAKSKKYEQAKEITTPDGFINTDDFTIQDNIGKKVILVDFWTYSCINCKRTLPFVNAWYEKYKDQGLEIVGVHTPEFDFEKVYENVKAAVEKFGIKHPVVLDNDYSTWYAYKNRYWPRKYIIDIDGFIIYDHIGEGAYKETEKVIQKALAERAQVLQENMNIKGGTVSPGEKQSSSSSRSPETYFGSARNKNLGNGEPGMKGVQEFLIPDNLKDTTIYLEGAWDIQSEYATNINENARIIFHYNAKNVFIVLDVLDKLNSFENIDNIEEQNLKIKIYRDGELITDAKGSSVEKNGFLQIKKAGLYELINEEKSGEHKLEIEILNAGLKIFTFTFG